MVATASNKAKAEKAMIGSFDFGSGFSTCGSRRATAVTGLFGVVVFAPATEGAGADGAPLCVCGMAATKRGLAWLEVTGAGGVLLLPCIGGTGIMPGASVSALLSRSLGLRSSSKPVSDGGFSGGWAGGGPKPGRGVTVKGGSWIIGSQASSVSSLSVSCPLSGTTTQVL